MDIYLKSEEGSWVEIKTDTSKQNGIIDIFNKFKYIAININISAEELYSLTTTLAGKHILHSFGSNPLIIGVTILVPQVSCSDTKTEKQYTLKDFLKVYDENKLSKAQTTSKLYLPYTDLVLQGYITGLQISYSKPKFPALTCKFIALKGSFT